MKLYQFLNFAREINNNDSVNKILLSKLLEKDLTWIYANLNIIIADSEVKLAKYLNLVIKYHDGFPLGYILGYSFFKNNKIFIDQNVLIPRNETELLVEKTLFYINKFFDSDSLDILDLATGSGCIAISIALENSKWNITASDVSIQALSVAKINQKFYHLKNIKLIQSDLFQNLDNQKFNIIISNPPYIDKNANNYNINNLQHEPELALFADNYGLDFYQRIFASVLKFTKKDFFIAFEIGFDQKESLEKLLKKNFDNYFYWFEKDYSSHFRFLFISSKAL